MKWIPLITIFNLLVLFAAAQRSEIDSLLHLLKAHTKDDTVKIDLLNEIAFTYCRIDAPKGMQAANDALQLAQKLKDMPRMALAYSRKGVNLHTLGEDSLALTVYAEALRIHKKIGNKIGIASVSHNMGLIYNSRSEYNKAIEFHTIALKILENVRDSKRLPNAFNSIGVNHMYLGNYPKALEYYLKTLDAYEKNHDETGKANAYTNLGLFYRRIKDYTKALENQQKALAIFKKNNIKQGEAGALSNIGVIYSEKNENKKAIQYFMQALGINEKLSGKQAIASDLTNIGVSLTDLHEYAKALEFLTRALVMYEQLDNKHHVAIIYNQLGKIYAMAPVKILQKDGVTSSNRIDKAIAYVQRSLLLSSEAEAVDEQMNSWEILSNIYENQNTNDKALKAYKQFILLRDSIMNDEKKQQIAKNEIEFEFQKKEALIKSEHAAELTRQSIIKNALMSGTAVLIAGGIVIFIFYKRKRDAVVRQKEAELKVQIADVEMKALRSQMNPHFIFNSLNSISDYIGKNNTTLADEYLTKFAKLMRMILENSELKEVSLAEDLRALELYMQLEALRMNNKFAYEIKIDTDIDPENTLVPPLILQPFVENSIWHGIAQKNGPGKIRIQIRKELGMINCIVEDDGIGMEQSASSSALNKPSQKSLGMKITTARLDIINKVKKTAASIQLSPLRQGTRVEVKLPLELNF